MTQFNINEYEISYDFDNITITKDNMYVHIAGSDDVLAFCEHTDDLNDYDAIDTYFENNFTFSHGY